MTALNELSLDDARKFVNNGDVTSLELVQACLKQMKSMTTSLIHL